METKGKASGMVDAIVTYIYEEGAGKVTMAETLGIIEFVKLQIIEDLKEMD